MEENKVTSIEYIERYFSDQLSESELKEFTEAIIKDPELANKVLNYGEWRERMLEKMDDYETELVVSYVRDELNPEAREEFEILINEFPEIKEEIAQVKELFRMSAALKDSKKITSEDAVGQFHINDTGQLIYSGDDPGIKSLLEESVFQKNENLELQVEEYALPIELRGAYMGEGIDDPFELPYKDETSVTGTFIFKIKNDFNYYPELGLIVRIYDSDENIIDEIEIIKTTHYVNINKPGRFYWKVVDKDFTLIKVGRIFNLKR